jgi:hypothetical protein
MENIIHEDSLKALPNENDLIIPKRFFLFCRRFIDIPPNCFQENEIFLIYFIIIRI